MAATAAPVAPADAPEQTGPATFYAPDRPDSNVVIAGPEDQRGLAFWDRTIKFHGESYATSRPEEIAALRRGVAKGLYFEADLPEAAALPCEVCGKTFRNATAFGRHARRHAARD